MKKAILFLCVALFALGLKSNGQTFVFDTVTSTPGCPENITYKFSPRLFLIGVRVNQIYNDDGDNSPGGASSFNFSLLFNYGNIFTDTAGNIMDTLNAGPFASTTFYTYLVSFYSHDPHVNPPNTTNNCNNVPLTTDTSGVQFDNNNTFHGSASFLGLTANTTYYSQDIIDIFGVDSAAITVNAPCLSYTAAPGLPEQQVPLGTGLSSFNAIKKEGAVVLLWTTQSERNNTGFSVEKSRDGSAWARIAWVPTKAPNGTANETLSYEYNDLTIWDGNNIYRLVGIDASGKQTISKVVSVQNVIADKYIYPNPASDRVHIPTSFRQVSVMDLAGRNVTKGSCDRYGDMDVSKLPCGTYILRSGDKVCRLVINR